VIRLSASSAECIFVLSFKLPRRVLDPLVPCRAHGQFSFVPLYLLRKARATMGEECEAWAVTDAGAAFIASGVETGVEARKACLLVVELVA
jgi:hypothetical protein